MTKKIKQTIIPAGYRLTVDSWENDADNRRTVVVEGLSFEKCAFYVELCKLMQDDRYRNLYEPDDGEVEAAQKAFQRLVKKQLKKHGTVDIDFDDLDDLEMLADHVGSILYDLGLAGGDYFTRVCDAWKVEYIDAPIVMSDVSKEFK